MAQGRIPSPNNFVKFHQQSNLEKFCDRFHEIYPCIPLIIAIIGYSFTDENSDLCFMEKK